MLELVKKSFNYLINIILQRYDYKMSNKPNYDIDYHLYLFSIYSLICYVIGVITFLFQWISIGCVPESLLTLFLYPMVT